MTIAAYAAAPMAIMLGGLGLAWFLLLIGIIVIFCCAARLQQAGRVVAIVAALLIVGMQGLTMAGLALIAGFGVYPQAVSFLFSALLWIPVLMVVMSLTSTAWRTSLLVAKMCRRQPGVGQEDANRFGCGPSIKSLAKASFGAAMKRPVIFMLATLLALGSTMAVNLGLSQVCYCTNPTSLTTWSSRRSDTHYCIENTFCHLYAVAGETSSTMRIVGHMVVDSIDSRPRASTLKVCETSRATPSTCITGVPRTLQSKIIDHAHISEDFRYLSHTTLTNLTGETYYMVEVFFDGPASSSKTLVFQTPPDPNSTSTVKMLSGGDVHQGAKFTDLLKAAMLQEPDPHLILLGGDLSYANNMRTCYLRWDEFLHDLSSVRTRTGGAVPLLTIPGNHESGGYLRWSDRQDYYFYTQYLPQYDDDQVTVSPTTTSGIEHVRDSTITYHRHRFGNKLGIIGLDSNLMVSITDQSSYLKTTLELMRSFPPRFVIVLQHNPMFPAHRALSSGSTEEMRAEWLPIFDLYKVPLVLEFHDHSYKRTWPMFGTSVRQTDGTIYVGDGALGVFSNRLADLSRGYLDKTYSGNYINILHALSNGTVLTTTVGSSGHNIDGFATHLRHV